MAFPKPQPSALKPAPQTVPRFGVWGLGAEDLGCGVEGIGFRALKPSKSERLQAQRTAGGWLTQVLHDCDAPLVAPFSDPKP